MAERTALRTAVAGLGFIGAARSRAADLPGMPGSHVEACTVLPDVDLVAVCDPDPAARERFETTWGNRWPGMRPFADCAEMLASVRPDLLCVCSPDHLHRAVVEAACGFGVRGVFCEKPLATTLDDADAILAAARAAGVALSADRLVRAEIRRGAIGSVSRIVATLGGPRAMLFRNGTHLIDAVLMMLGKGTASEPDWVIGVLDAGFEDYASYRGDGGTDPALDPGVSGLMQFRDGVRVFVNASKGTPPRFALELFGDRGRITISDQEGAHLVVDDRTRPLIPAATRYSGIAAGLVELARRIEEPRTPLACCGTEARKTLRILLGLLASQEAGGSRVNL
jgi:UDP-N-acetyl-2-amino-2-deoxyglucuronate dehydrogenase